MAAAAFLLYLATACRTVWFGDSGELIAAAACLGVAHPPGYPLWTALGKLFLLLPVGEPAFRVNLLSAVGAAAACGVATLLVARATGSRVGALSGGAFLAVSSTFWSVATVAEVYSLHVFLGLSLLACAQSLGRDRRTGALVGAAVALGLGLAHHPTIVLWIPAAAWLACRTETGPRRTRLPARPIALAASLAGALALAVLFYGWMLLRARGAPPSNWGDPSTIGALVQHATASAFRHLDLGWRGLLRPEAWAQLGDVLGWDLAWVGALAGALGLARPGSRRETRTLAGSLGALAVLSLLFGLRYSVDDREVFVLPALVALAIAGGIAVSRLEEWKRPVGWAVCLLVVAASVVSHGKSRDLRQITAAREYARDVLCTIPEGGLLFVESDDAFPLLYATQVLGERPDVVVYHRQGVLFRDLTREVRPPPGAPADWSHDRVRVEQAYLGGLLSRERNREAWFLGWPGYDPPPAFRLEPVGLLWRLSWAERRPAAPSAPWREYREAEVRRVAERSGQALPRAFAATYPLSRGERALFDGDVSRAEEEMADALRVAGSGSSIPVAVGTAWARVGEWDRAISSFRAAVAANPASYAGWSNLARALELGGDPAGAREARRRAESLESMR